jgi:hypothetical protein
MKKESEALLKKHEKLIQSLDQKVISHVQREQDEWFINTLMIEGVDVPFQYKRKKLYKSLKGARVNLTYYPEQTEVAGFELEIMKVIRLRVS